eukprot:1944087-Karenia_brevis.AAC.1
MDRAEPGTDKNDRPGLSINLDIKTLKRFAKDYREYDIFDTGPGPGPWGAGRRHSIYVPCA